MTVIDEAHDWDEDARWYYMTLDDGTHVRLITAFGADVAKRRAEDSRGHKVVSVDAVVPLRPAPLL